jgi:hypothetical protein
METLIESENVSGMQRAAKPTWPVMGIWNSF